MWTYACEIPPAGSCSQTDGDAVKRVSAGALDRSGEIEFEFLRSPGPGGQNVNKVSTGVRLRWDLRASRSIPEEVIDRLKRVAGRKVTDAGLLVIEAHRFRTQERNREDALRRLDDLIEKAWSRPRPRRPTRPTEASKKKRLEEKRRRGQIKKARGSSAEEVE
jgi:ribosome-associated protein